MQKSTNGIESQICICVMQNGEKLYVYHCEDIALDIVDVLVDCEEGTCPGSKCQAWQRLT